MPTPKPGEVWLLRFPFTDLTSGKLRPALIWAVHGEDVIVLGIFSRVPTGRYSKSWISIEEGHPDFQQTGLKKTSLVKAEKITVVHQSILQRKLGVFSEDLGKNVKHALKAALRLTDD